MEGERLRKIWALVVVAVVAAALAALLVLAQPYGEPLGFAVRVSAILAYEAVFLATVSSASMKLMKRLFGRPFVKVHHVLSISGLVLMAVHPLAHVIEVNDLSVLVPEFDTLEVFLRLGGRPALYLFALTSLTAALRRPAGRGWRWLHLVNYAAFALASTHALAIGTDFVEWPARAVPLVFASAVLFVLVRRRLGRR